MNELKQKTITALNKQVGLLIEGGVPDWCWAVTWGIMIASLVASFIRGA